MFDPSWERQFTGDDPMDKREFVTAYALARASVITDSRKGRDDIDIKNLVADGVALWNEIADQTIGSPE